MKIAVAQLYSSDNKKENLIKAKEYIMQAKEEKADFIVFPEHYMVTLSSTSTLNRVDVAESIDGPFVTELCQLAYDNQIYIMCGIYEYKENDKHRSYNSVVTINRNGEVIDCYRKSYLFDAFNSRESDTSITGTEPPKVIDTEFGKIGVIICYEIRFPELTRYLVNKGADIIFVPTAWKDGFLKEHHWKTLLQARAIENTSFIIGVDQIYNNNVGSSMIVDPMGVPIASAGEVETLLCARIDIERLSSVREKLPSLKHQKLSSYFCKD